MDTRCSLMVRRTRSQRSTRISVFNYLRDIAPVASMFRAPHSMEVHPPFPAETVAEFIAYAKAHPGRINMASAGIGTISHMAGGGLESIERCQVTTRRSH